MRRLKICLTASELAPLAKTGGLADVCSALAAYLHDNGHEVRVLLPFYSTIDTDSIDPKPVDFLQNIPIALGSHRFEFSIDTARLPGTELMIYLLRCPELYQRRGIYTSAADEHLRFVLLSRASIEMCQRMGFAPDVVHCNDWHTALVPLYLHTLYAWDKLFERTRTLLTIHNIGYQGIFNASVLPDTGLSDSAELLDQDDLTLGRINFLKTGILYAGALNTVSPTYAQEIQTEEYGMGLQHLLRARHDSLIGILNGVDYSEWDPEHDPHIPHPFSRSRLAAKKKNKQALMGELGLSFHKDHPLIGIVSRLTFQKGIDLIQQVLPEVLKRREFSIAVLGSGESRYEQFFTWLQNNYRARVCYYRGFNNKLAHWIEAGADMLLMPSRYEPCGLNQMYSLRYGTVPIVRETGGLADSVKLYDPASQKGTGIVFRDYNKDGLVWALNSALDLYQDKKTWRSLMRNGMAEDYSWHKQGALYVELYTKLAARIG